MTRRLLILLASLLLLAPGVFAGKKQPPAPDKPSGMVDEGTFAIFQNGQRMATETFTIRQLAASSVTSSQIHLDSAGQPTGVVQQSSELTLLPDGTLSRYEWNQLSPTPQSATVVPGDQVLTMHVLVDGKSSEKSFFLTPATFVLDDYFFSTREVLLWRYLASSCKPRTTGEGCDLIRARFPILVPRRSTSAEVFIEFKGYDDMPLNGRPQHLRHFVMQTEGPDWNFWMDADFKLLRISIPDANTEVLRQEK